jgi:hypothetical protein
VLKVRKLELFLALGLLLLAASFPWGIQYYQVSDREGTSHHLFSPWPGNIMVRQVEQPLDRSVGFEPRPNVVQVSFDYPFSKHLLLTWGTVVEFKPAIRAAGFFFPLIVLLFFSRFYRSSRTNPGEEDAPFRNVCKI